MNIRSVKESDFQNIYDLVKVAFTTAQVSDGTEQDFVYHLRSGQNYIPELEFVAEDEDGLIGHIMMTKQFVTTLDGSYEGVLIAPLCVKLESRNKGVGKALIKYASEQAVNLGYHAAFLVGNPLYYGRFGYKKTSDFEIKNLSKIPDDVVLGCELILNALKNVSGTIDIV